VLLCNNTAVWPIRLIKRSHCREAVLRMAARQPILRVMGEADDLARRFFDLWAEYLAALMSDPKTAEPLRRWLAVAAGAMALPDDGRAARAPRSPTDAPAAAGPSGERDVAVAELARRIDELHERIAVLERRPRLPGGARRRDRTPRG
jgi:hypothetical protein